jgi:arginine decarboxylase
MYNGMIYNRLVIGNRIPKDYIVTRGFGDTDIGPGNNPWETGAFDMALQAAGIENFNILKYTSVIPPEATEIPIERARALYYHPGAAMEAIIAQTNGYKGDRICAGLGRIFVRRISDKKPIVGYAAEYVGNGDKDEARRLLHKSLINIFLRRYDPGEYEVYGERFCIQEHIVKNKYGTVISVIGFLSYIYPVFGRIRY